MRYLTFTFLFLAFASAAFASQDKSQVVIRVQSEKNGNIDETTLYFDNGIHPTYVNQEDAPKIFSNVAGVPALFSLSSDSINCTINGFNSPYATDEIAVGCKVDSDGAYDFSLPVLDNLNPTSIIRLEDRALGVFTDLRQSKYTAQILASDSATGRFFIHVSSPVQVTPVSAGCTNNSGAINITQDNSVAWTSVTLFDAYQNQVGILSNATGQFNFSNLASGGYFIVYAYGSYTTTQEFYVDGHFITASFISSAQNVEVGQNIDFTSTVTNAQYYSWDFGDGTLITGVANPSVTYHQAGNFTVKLTCTNDYGCSEVAEANVSVETPSGINEAKAANNASVYAYEKSVKVTLNDVPDANAEMQVYNLLGQSVYSSTLTSQTTDASLDNQPNGYYLVSVKNKGVANTQRVFLVK